MITPTQVAVVGRSPVMTPTATGSNAAPTADSGATTLIRPALRPR